MTAIGDIATAAPSAPVGGGPRVRAFREALGLLPAAATATIRGLDRDLDLAAARGIAAGISPHAP
ncbi:MAG: hypothetical protein ACKONH_06470 [Planctomycetia bacterium]